MGIETEVVHDVVTDKQHGLIITYREGKASALLARTGGFAPYFASATPKATNGFSSAQPTYAW